MEGQPTISVFLLRLQYPLALIGISFFISDPALACLCACMFVGLCSCVFAFPPVAVVIYFKLSIPQSGPPVVLNQ